MMNNTEIATTDDATSRTADAVESLKADAAATVERAHEPIGDMKSLVGWMQSNLGIMGAAQAMQNAAFILCCDVICQDMAKARLYLRERIDHRTSKIVAPWDHKVAGLLAYRPNDHQTWHEYIEMMGFWLCLKQNAHAIVDRNAFGDPLALIPLMSGQQQAFVAGDDLYYECTASTQFQQLLMRAPYRRVFEPDMIHVRGRMMNGFDGLSTLEIGRSTLNTAAAIDSWRDEIFMEKGQIRGVFAKPDGNPLPDLAFERLRQGLRSLMSRFKQNVDPIVLEGGLTFEHLSSNPTEAELSKNFEQQIIAVCRLLRVPPHKVFQMGGVKYENLDTLEAAYIGDTLVPNFDRMEQRHTVTLLTRHEIVNRGLFLQHDREAVQLNDAKKQAEKAEIATKYGGITVDEFRSLMYGLPPLADGSGKMRLLSTQMQLIDEKNNIVVGGAGVAPDGSTPAKAPAAKKEA